MLRLIRRRRLAMRNPNRQRAWQRTVARALTTLLVFSAGVGFVRAFGTRQTAIEEVVRRSDLVVLGKVISKDPHETEGPHLSGTFTRNTFRVEAYYKGEGPKEISLLTHGGVWTDPNGNTRVTQAVGAEGVRVGEEMVAFLKAGPGGYYFSGWDGNAKRMVETDPETGERTVGLRLSKRCYMGPAMQAKFDEAERWDKNPNAPVASQLPNGKSLTEVIPVKELAARLAAIIRGESVPANP